VFTDQPVTPKRLETLVEVMRHFRPRALSRQAIYELLQPQGLPALKESSDQARHVVGAAVELELLEPDGQALRLADAASGAKRPVRGVVLEAIDRRVLAISDVEPYFATFYAYLLGRGVTGGRKQSGQAWADEFNRAVNRGSLGDNPFNKDKYSGLGRWYRYVGLGWDDPSGVFMCNPYQRLLRSLPALFAGDRRLDASDFMQRLALTCPELDGGSLFVIANPGFNAEDRTCTLGLSHALIELHEEGVVELDCPSDSTGWSVGLADPPRDGRTMRSSRMSAVTFMKA
jgi:hypothetical protein